MIAIDDITFEYVELYSDDGPEDVALSSVGVDYTILKGHNKVRGQLHIEPDEYREMIYRDVLDKIRKHFNETVDNI